MFWQEDFQGRHTEVFDEDTPTGKVPNYPRYYQIILIVIRTLYKNFISKRRNSFQFHIPRFIQILNRIWSRILECLQWTRWLYCVNSRWPSCWVSKILSNLGNEHRECENRMSLSKWWKMPKMNMPKVLELFTLKIY